jgi:hypothetical protein
VRKPHVETIRAALRYMKKISGYLLLSNLSFSTTLTLFQLQPSCYCTRREDFDKNYLNPFPPKTQTTKP